MVADFKPTKVFVTHPADTNPDHVAYDLFLRTVLWDLEDEVKPEVYNYLTHYGEWPKPRGLHFDAPHEPPAQFDEAGRWVTLPLEPEQVKQKLEALKRHKTQYAASKVYLESYMRANELFDRIKDIPLAPGAEDVLLLPSGTGVAAGSALPEGAVTDGHAPRPRGRRCAGLHGGARPRPQLRPWKPIFRRSVIDPISLLARCPRSTSPRGFEPQSSDKRQELPADSVQVTRHPGQIEVRIPLALLGNPERLFFTAKAKGGGASLDVLPWVVLDLTSGK